MRVVNPLTKEQAPAELQDTFEKLAARAGKVPNIFAAMAHRPAALNTVLPLYKAVINEGTVGAKYKELAYLRASMVNACEYCTRPHIASSKGAGVTAEQVAALPFYSRSPLFDEKEKATILYADRVTRRSGHARPRASGIAQVLRRRSNRRADPGHLHGEFH
jgi:AhpD family alkylhydroperoxidase